MPLQNRVSPDGTIFAGPARGLLFGNRGGRIHDPATRTLLARRWASKQWICCRLAFKDRRRTVMGSGYTELFFLDEVTALAAGHRPCFECRRADATAFAGFWATAQGLGRPPRAGEIDRVLHHERLEGRGKRRHMRDVAGLPDGAMVMQDAGPLAVRGDALLPWSSAGYGAPLPRPTAGTATVLTPPAILAVLASGYQPLWHPSAG